MRRACFAAFASGDVNQTSHDFQGSIVVSYNRTDVVSLGTPVAATEVESDHVTSASPEKLTVQPDAVNFSGACCAICPGVGWLIHNHRIDNKHTVNPSWKDSNALVSKIVVKITMLEQ